MKYLLLLLSILVFTNLYSQDHLNPCLQSQSFHVVVLGSSTAAGAGASTSDSAWVNRYREYLQSINPLNQVTNLAVGGYTTYQIMPDWFVAPTGKPAVNSNQNVSKAVSLNADAIIINLPSNDAAWGFGIDEQMSNFHTIANHADSAGIPVWICTTQPKAAFPPAKDSIQLGVADSILTFYGSFGIDLWSYLALPNLKLDSTYDSGDGTHLNDKGHGLLNTIVKGKNILSEIFDTLGVEDHLISDLSINGNSLCGDTATVLKLLSINRGPVSNYNIPVTIEFNDHLNSTTYQVLDTIYGGMSTCVTDTIIYKINTYAGADISVSAWLTTMNDTILSNDTLGSVPYFSSGHPAITAINDTICKNDTATLMAFSSDTPVWYDKFGQLLQIGSSLDVNNIQQTDTFYVEAVSGPLHFHSSIPTTITSSIHWNGFMFDLIAHDSIVIDSFMVRVFDTGQGIVNSYTKQGSHIGSESDTSAWTFWSKDTVMVNQQDEFVYVNFGTLSMMPGDTIGIYLHMENSSQRLSYKHLSGPVNNSDSTLTIYSGSGISHIFANSYFPRQWNGEVFYHYGFNPSGDCQSEREEVIAYVSKPQTNLVPDIGGGLNVPIVLDAGSGFVSYLWNTMDTTQTITVVAMPDCVTPYWVIVTDKYGCSTADTVTVYYIGIDENQSDKQAINIYPNPSNGILNIDYMGDLPEILKILNLEGRMLFENRPKSDKETISLNLAPGSYELYFYYQDRIITKRLIVI